MGASISEVPAFIALMLNVALAGYFLAGVAYGVLLVARRPGTPIPLRIVLYLLSLEHGATLGIRWVLTDRPPLISTYEMLISIAWLIPIVWLIVERFAPLLLVGAVSYISAALALAYGNILDRSITPLVPALQSNWLTAHIFTYLVAYAGALVAMILAILYLARTGPTHRTAVSVVSGVIISSVLLGVDVDRNSAALGSVPAVGFLGFALFGGILMATPIWAVLGFLVRKAPNAMPSSPDLLNRLVGFTFPFLTLGIVTGVIWAEQAWGPYWSWDNKENWALVTWAVYAAYLHSVYVMRWRHAASVYLVIAGFVAIMITWLGVNYLPFLRDPLHSYVSGNANLAAAHWGFGLYPQAALISLVLSAILMVWTKPDS